MRVLLADNRAKVRSALQLLLEQEPGVDVVGEATSSGALLMLAAEQNPDLVLLDWDLPGSPAALLVPGLRHMVPAVKIIVLSGRPEARLAAQEMGVEAFVSKNAPSEELLAAMELCRTRRDSRLPAAGGEAAGL